jgi:hypothetical protein
VAINFSTPTNSVFSLSPTTRDRVVGEQDLGCGFILRLQMRIGMIT